MTEDNIDWGELERRHADGDVTYQILETIKAGQKAARSLRHPLDRYFASDTITGRQYDAGQKLWEDWTLSQSKTSGMQWDGTPPPTAYGSATPNDRQLDAARRYTNALLQIGRRASLTLTDIVLCELTLEEHGARVGQTRLQVMGSLKMALDMLADTYRMGR